MATLIRNEFINSRGHSNLMVDNASTLVVGNTVAIGPKYNAVIEAFLPVNQIRVKLLPLSAPGSYQLIFRRGVTVA